MDSTIEYVHARGLKFGLYGDRGSLDCARNPGAQGHETQDAAFFAKYEYQCIYLFIFDEIIPHWLGLAFEHALELFVARCSAFVPRACYPAHGARRVLLGVDVGRMLIDAVPDSHVSLDSGFT